MKSSTWRLAWCTALVAATTASGQAIAQQSSKPIPNQVPTRPLLLRFEDVIGSGLWKYTWPHGKVPQKIANFQLVASPVEGVDGDQGRTMANWGRPVIFESPTSGARVSVKCYKDYSGVRMDQPWLDPDWPPPVLQAMAFHGLKAGAIMGLVPSSQPAGPQDTRPALNAPPDSRQRSRADFVFRMGDTVFGIHAEGKASSDRIWTATVEVAEEVYASQTPRVIPATLQRRFRPALGIEYVIAGPSLYRTQPVAADVGTEQAWSVARELIYRTALNDEYDILPGSGIFRLANGVYRARFHGKQGQGDLFIEVRKQSDGDFVKIVEQSHPKQSPQKTPLPQ